MPFIQNIWYAAGWANELADNLVPRTLLREPVVLYRTEGGKAVALADRCAHRFVPLSRGKRKGDIIECGYHGLCFDASGACVFNPHGDHTIPRAARVRAIPSSSVTVFFGFGWVIQPKRMTQKSGASLNLGKTVDLPASKVA